VAPRAAAAAAGADEAVRKEYTRRIREYGRKRNAGAAVDALVALGQEGVAPDLVAASTCLQACAGAADIGRATMVFDEMFASGLVEPDELVFAIMMRAYGAEDPPRWADVAALLGRMRHSFGITPGAKTYNALLETCARTNDVERGLQVLDRMDQEGVEPDAFTVEAVAGRKVLRSALRKTFSA